MSKNIWYSFPRKSPARAGCLSICLGVLVIAGCSSGSGSGNSGNNIAVTITNKVTSVQAGTGASTFTATVQNDSTSSGVTWSLTANGVACSPSCGTLSQVTSTSVLYTPPAASPSTVNNQTLTATSVAKSNKSDSDSFTISAALAVIITNKFSTVNTTASPFVVTATVQNDSTNSGVDWSLSLNGAPCMPGCGTLSGATATTVTYTPPQSGPGIRPVLTATSIYDGSKSDDNSFQIQQPPIVVIIQNKVANAIAGGPNIFFGASIQNDPSSIPVINWKLIVNGADCQPMCGTLTAAGTQSIIYAPPVSVPAAPYNQPTLMAVSNTDSTKSDSDLFTISPAPPISVTVTQVASILAGATGGVNFSANVQNDFSSPPQGVTWTLTTAGLPCTPACGSLSNNGPKNVVYTPPQTVPASPNDQPTLTATSVADNTKSGSDTFSIASVVANQCGASGGAESLLNGHYALLVEGFAGTAGTPVFEVAAFSATGSGVVSDGEEDINDTISPQHLTLSSTGSLYTVGSDHRGCLQLTNTGGTTAVFRFALASINGSVASKGRIIEFDNNSSAGAGSRGSGILRQQDPNAFVLTALQTQYSFGVSGWGISNNRLVPFSAAGAFSNSGGALSNGMDDIDFDGVTEPRSTGLSSGTHPIQPVSANTGRTTGSFDFFDWAIYIVNSQEFFTIGTDPIEDTVSAGSAVATGNSFTGASLSGSYVIHATGNTNGSGNANLELLTMIPGGAQTGTLSETVYSYGGGSGAQTVTLSGVTYNVEAASGRTVLGNPGDNFPILYLTTPTDGIGAFVVGVGADALFGFAEQQASPALTAGTYVFSTENPSDNSVTNKAGVESISSGGAVTGTYDQSNISGLSTSQTFNTTVSLNSNGIGNIGPNTVAIATGTKLFSIDETGGAGGPAAILAGEQ